MEIIDTIFEEAKLIKVKKHDDSRGYFLESFNEKEFHKSGLHYQFIQDNHSYSMHKGTLRGLHYQLNPWAQTKLIRVIAGEIMDVIVDLRKSSKTYGKWQSFILNSAENIQLLVPKGFAHGFCTLTKDTHVFYKVDNYYSKKHERGIIWNDKSLNISWPFDKIIASEKDNNLSSFLDCENNFF
ncbi:dTDP-4-dehydrorhamnose 3,5-epimerase [Bacillus sp. THAF10]|uniref:dTDP-4-dehydrorhamnose 3,5-epimerase n=1 Tax=Bacillus sp. THAF10 TaxID=2587848 RepID=UPI0012685ACB|nr:dTDP-4-dehydrorhamnose 3,5-epimerase [Bacillus sp. THAF10]QFT88417.1 dTDP-4-dehydrorhamnose 3,5-epimerase [Bacillus sp. THAF10]